MRTMCNQRLDRSRLYEVVAAIIIVICLECSEAPSPVEPSPPSARTVKEFSLFGMVHDTAFRPVADVQIRGG